MHRYYFKCWNITFCCLAEILDVFLRLMWCFFSPTRIFSSLNYVDLHINMVYLSLLWGYSQNNAILSFFLSDYVFYLAFFIIYLFLSALPPPLFFPSFLSFILLALFLVYVLLCLLFFIPFRTKHVERLLFRICARQQ